MFTMNVIFSYRYHSNTKKLHVACQSSKFSTALHLISATSGLRNKDWVYWQTKNFIVSLSSVFVKKKMAGPAGKIQHRSIAVNVLCGNILANKNNHNYDLRELFYAQDTSVCVCVCVCVCTVTHSQTSAIHSSATLTYPCFHLQFYVLHYIYIPFQYFAFYIYI
jgi:hypothetical protein